MVGLLLAAGCDDAATTAPPVSVLSVPAGCDPLQQCALSGEKLSLQVSFDAPARALQPFSVSVLIHGEEPVQTVMLTFSMPSMDMGQNRYRLQGDPAGRWTGKVILPVCVSGRSDWLAALEVTTAKRRYQAQLPFVLHK